MHDDAVKLKGQPASAMMQMAAFPFRSMETSA